MQRTQNLSSIVALLVLGMTSARVAAQPPTPWQPRTLSTSTSQETAPPLPPAPAPLPPTPESQPPINAHHNAPRPTALGIVLGTSNPSLLQVNRVQDHSAAAWAGVQPGDIVVAINGRVVRNIDGLGSESVLTMTVIRAGKPLQLDFVPPSPSPTVARQPAEGSPAPNYSTTRHDSPYGRINHYGYPGNPSGPNLPNDYPLWVPPGWPLVPYGPGFFPGPYRGRPKFYGGQYRGRPDEVPPPWPGGF